MEQRHSCPICVSTDFIEEFEYTKPPQGEIRFDFSKQGQYYRKILRCERCHHYISTYKINLAALYSSDYINSNYRDMEGMGRTFRRIISLDPSKSDNTGRVKRIIEFGEMYFSKQGRKGFIPSVLDVGSGLGIFPYGIVKEGWKCTAIDPDDRAVRHIRDIVGVETIHGDFMTVDDTGEYDVITFNKVLEHVEQPVEMLKKAKNILNKNGFIYVEVPDGEMAAMEGKEREEFFIDHIHIFSFTSLSLLLQKSGLLPLVIERLKEPSTKYTITAFCGVSG